MSTEPTPPYTAEQLAGEAVTKKELVTFLQENGTLEFLVAQKLKGPVKNIAKTRNKDQLVASYNELFATKAFRKEGEVLETGSKKSEVDKVTEGTKKLDIKEKPAEAQVEPKYKKRVLKKGDRVNFPRKGDTVSCFYKGMLQDGTEFDSNVTSARRGKKPQPLRFKVGAGKVIKGWDEAVLTMSAGEKAELTIEPEWAYGKKGLEGKIPPNATLTFEVELCGYE